MGNKKSFKTYKALETSESRMVRKERTINLATARKEKYHAGEEEFESFFTARKTVKY